MASAKVRHQKRRVGGRSRVYAAVEPETERLVRMAARRFGVSRSFVINTVLSSDFGVELEDRYYEAPARLRRVK